MRFIFQLLIGMIFFNMMLFAFSPYFPTQKKGPTYSAVNATGSDTFIDYQNLDVQKILIGFLANSTMLAVGGAFIFGLIVLKLLLGNIPTLQIIGGAFIISLFVGLYNGLSSPFVSIVKEYPVLDQFYAIFSIALGMVVTISIIEIFTGKGDESA